jgi:hypothetical protein
MAGTKAAHKPPTHGDPGYRKHRYAQSIRAQLEENGLRSPEIERLIDRIGFTKLIFMARHITPGTTDRWIIEARGKRSDVIRQEYGGPGRRRPMPGSEQIKPLVVKALLADAARAHGRTTGTRADGVRVGSRRRWLRSFLGNMFFAAPLC